MLFAVLEPSFAVLDATPSMEDALVRLISSSSQVVERARVRKMADNSPLVGVKKKKKTATNSFSIWTQIFYFCDSVFCVFQAVCA